MERGVKNRRKNEGDLMLVVNSKAKTTKTKQLHPHRGRKFMKRRRRGKRETRQWVSRLHNHRTERTRTK